MAFTFSDAKSVDTSTQQGYMFKNGVKYSYFKADENRPLSFRILPAFSEHEGVMENKMDYVPAVSVISGKPVVNDWIFAIFASRSFVKGAFPILSRRTLVERNVDGTIVRQEDPLSKVIDYCLQNSSSWGYVVEDQGKWGDPNRVPARLPPIKPLYALNVITFDDDKPGAKLALISSVTAVMDLCRTKQGNEGIALKQAPFEIPDDEIARNPSAMFQYGDITDPNGAPVFKYAKGMSDDGAKKVYRITVGIEVDPSTGRQRVEEQVQQLVKALGGRNKDGYHEYDMLRVALSDYAGLIPEVPPAPGAVNAVRGFASAQPAQAAAPKQFQPATQPQAFKPAVQPVAHTQPPQAFKTARPAFVPTAASAKAAAAPAPTPPVQEPQPTQGVPGETSYDEETWVNQYMGQ